jgi:hypothetical protein
MKTFTLSPTGRPKSRQKVAINPTKKANPSTNRGICPTKPENGPDFA